jgi:hypothetical protein
MKLIHTTCLLVLSACLSLATTSIANDFDDRDSLTVKLTLDEQAPLADAEEELAEAQDELDAANELLDAAGEELEQAEAEAMAAAEALAAADEALLEANDAVTAAQSDLDAANEELEEGIEQGLMGDDLLPLIAAVEAAEEEVLVATGEAQEARDAADEAQMDSDAANMDVADAQEVVDAADEVADAAEMNRDDAAEIVAAINEEIDGTEEFVDNLDDRTVFALNRSLNNAVRTRLLPLDIDLDELNRITDEDFGNGEIQQLTQAFETEARFERLATRFDAKAEATGREQFTVNAERARNRGQERKESFLDRIGDGNDVGPTAAEVSSAAVEVASAAASDAAAQAAEDASEQAAEAVGAVAQETAAEQAEATVGEIAREVAKQRGNRGRN